MYNHARYNDILRFLKTHQHAVLGSRLLCGSLTTSLVAYAVNEHLQLHFGSRRSYATCAALQQFPEVSITVMHASSQPRYAAEIRGRVEYIPSEHTDATRTWLLGRNPATLYDTSQDDFVVCKVNPHVVRFIDLAASQPTIEHLYI